MATPFQVATLVGTPLYPNAIAWSEENLIAAAADHIVTILNPDNPHGPRGVITLTVGNPFPIGVIDRKDLVNDCILPTCLSRDQRPSARSIAWSPVGFSSNGGCLLAICTTDGRVKIFRQPYGEYQAEWIEVIDVSEMLYQYFARTNYGERVVQPSTNSSDSFAQIGTQVPITGETNLLIRDKGLSFVEDIDSTKTATAFAEEIVFPSSDVFKGSDVEVFKMDGHRRVWTAAKLECFDGSKALVICTQEDANGNSGLRELIVSDPDHEDNIPRIRPSMNMSNIPEEICSTSCHGVDEILKVGGSVEAWMSDRWVEGLFMGLNGSGMQFKGHGDAEAVTINCKSVRLAPLWIKDEKVWKVPVVKICRKDKKSSEVVGKTSGDTNEKDLLQNGSTPISRKKNSKDIPQDSRVQFITADQYAKRSALLASLVVAWSPHLDVFAAAPDSSYGSCCLLAVGAKSGTVSIWKVPRPLSYSIEQDNSTPNMMLSSLVQMHNAWITALSWGILNSDALNPQLLLVTGSADGRVKIWRGFATGFLHSTEAIPAPFCMLNEVLPVEPAPVSVLSLVVTLQPCKILLACGRGSGAFKVYTVNTEAKSSILVGSGNAHNCAMTGFAWSFNGGLLYSCSQDNSLRGWIIHKGSLCEVPIPPNSLGTRIKARTNIPSVYDTCNGVTVSPGNLVMAVVRGFDPHVLNPMYQARTMKAAIEFFWIGGQQLDISSNLQLKFDDGILSGFPKEELVQWSSNILWSLNRFAGPGCHLVVWDIMAAALAFQQCAPKFIEHVLSRWVSSLFDGPSDLSSEQLLPDSSRSFSNIASRQLHLLNIVCRHLISPRVEDVNLKQSFAMENEEQWMELLLSSERELRERLVGFNFSAVLHLKAHLGTKEHVWDPVGVGQMLQWSSLECDQVRNRLGQLTSEVKTHFKRNYSTKKRPQIKENYDVDEQCCYCFAPVPFESPEVGLCQGVSYNNEDVQKHKLARCSVSMQACPLTPTWFCVCCQRRASRLAPEVLYELPCRPNDFGPFVQSLETYVYLEPLCPFCGILLQRSQPVYLLSTTPV